MAHATNSRIPNTDVIFRSNTRLGVLEKHQLDTSALPVPPAPSTKNSYDMSFMFVNDDDFYLEVMESAPSHDGHAAVRPRPIRKPFGNSIVRLRL